MVFSCIQPLLLPVCCLYFVVVYLVEVHQHMYVWGRDYESGGRMWSQVRCGTDGWMAPYHRLAWGHSTAAHAYMTEWKHAYAQGRSMANAVGIQGTVA